MELADLSPDEFVGALLPTMFSEDTPKETVDALAASMQALTRPGSGRWRVRPPRTCATCSPRSRSRHWSPLQHRGARRVQQRSPELPPRQWRLIETAFARAPTLAALVTGIAHWLPREPALLIQVRAARMELYATGGDRWQMGRRRQRLRQAKTVATSCREPKMVRRLSGSSPEIGLCKSRANRAFPCRRNLQELQYAVRMEPFMEPSAQRPTLSRP